MPSLAIVAAGVVVGFPMLTALALRSMSASHSTVFVGLLPLATSAGAVLRGGERPAAWFWAFSGAGSIVVGPFALSQAGSSDPAPNLLMVAAIGLCGLGYAEGTVLTRRLGGWQTICAGVVDGCRLTNLDRARLRRPADPSSPARNRLGRATLPCDGAGLT